MAKSMMIKGPGDHLSNLRGNILKISLFVKLAYGGFLFVTIHQPSQPIDLLKGPAHHLFRLISGGVYEGHGDKGAHSQPGSGNLVHLFVKLHRLGRDRNDTGRCHAQAKQA